MEIQEEPEKNAEKQTTTVAEKQMRLNLSSAFAPK